MTAHVSPLDLSPDDRGRLSYSLAAPAGLPRRLIRLCELVTGATRIERLYRQLPERMAQGTDVWTAILELLEVEVVCRGIPWEQIPATGPLLVVANHPFGVLDGTIACHLIARRRADVKLIAINLLSDFPETAPWVLPIDFAATPEALRTNLQSRAAALQRLQEGGAVVLFPAGEVATAPRVFGPAVENRWHPFAGRLVQATQAAVTPLYFRGQNSWLFHAASRLGPAARLALFLRETNRRSGATVEVIVGDPISNPQLRALGHRERIAAYLREQTLALASAPRADERPVLAAAGN